jgi:hypothetical protein
MIVHVDRVAAVAHSWFPRFLTVWRGVRDFAARQLAASFPDAQLRI